MLTGMDCFSTQIVALRHQGGMSKGLITLPQILANNGYNTTCVNYGGFKGFDTHLSMAQTWGSYAEGRSRKAESMNDTALPEIERLAKEDKPFLLFLRHMDPALRICRPSLTTDFLLRNNLIR